LVLGKTSLSILLLQTFQYLKQMPVEDYIAIGAGDEGATPSFGTINMPKWSNSYDA
jgi:hypothetical protein